MKQQISAQQALAFNVPSARVDGGPTGMPGTRKMRRVLAAIERKERKKARKASKRGAK
ncbi:hypothetical protein Q673_01560 [Marinobacter sp. EN3]|uniref:hypothetical protein n=1 Tax=Marinobacter sp. EN3 TaxID=1397533 RepID=UPI0003B83F4F|nr:hypothetical protein [Marinobacter sp. EN3]ERS12327.1 hypothetical protein Q673_01560 [Marinobacter sp. EN3]